MIHSQPLSCRITPLDHGAVGQPRPHVTAALADRATLAAAARLLLDQHFTPVLNEMICAAAGLDLPVLEAPVSARPCSRRWLGARREVGVVWSTNRCDVC
jgi:putative restriction endonuclease